ncbi:hypothetical protein JAAARDRAFT_210967 [Jaapia argillacea MUCL 33604]|uniref:F-box domain-containing protein n=1 Tax=Jaapia argillacea MUCL 33604 TaxID=933084 RepID=A0A067PA84_9AGAM|nr:hypothetical protein JAAARDRAFT_210967 [Jaapia argillacea MUCL 33604]
MHACLQLPELLSQIIEFLSPDPPWAKGTSNLATLARTCRLFYEPALDALWEHQSDLGPLIKCMPKDLWDESEDLESGLLITFRRPVVPVDWTRFDLYAPRVKCISYNRSKDREPIRPLTRLHDTVLQALKDRRSTVILFPNLREIHWPSTDKGELFSYLGPTVTSVSFQWPDSESEHGELGSIGFLTRVVTICPMLEDLQINNGDSQGVAFPPSFVETLCLLRHLRHLACDLVFITTRDVVRMAALPHLTSLFLAGRSTVDCGTAKGEWSRLIGGAGVSECPSEAISHPFSNLKHLVIISDSPSLDPWIQMLRFMEQPELELFHCYLRQAHHSATIVSLLQILAGRPSHRALASLHMDCLSRFEPHFPEDERNSFGNPLHVPSLVKFINLTKFHFIMHHHFSLDDATIKELAMAWPLLEEFEVKWPSSAEEWSSVTLEALVHLAHHCPHLQTIHLILGTTILPSLPPSETVNLTVRSLHFGQTPILDPKGVAAFLVGLFPKLETFCGISAEESIGDSLHAAFGVAWEEVQRLVTASRLGGSFDGAVP